MSNLNEKSALKSLVEMLPSEGSAVLVTSPLSLKYLSGLPVENGLLLASKEIQILFVTQREHELMKNKLSEVSVAVLTGGAQLLDILIKYGIKRVYIEAEKMTVSEYEVYKEQLHYANIDTSSKLDNALAELRGVKRESELAAIAKAQKICDAVYDRILGTVRKGMSERRIAMMLEYFLMKEGSDGEPLPITVLSGERTANPNLKPGDREIAEGDLLIMEFGARSGGYCAKMSRTCAVGKIDTKLENAYNAVSCAMLDGLKALRAGVGSKVPDSVAAATLNAWGVDKYSSTSFAHGIGLEPVEPPFLGRGAGVSLKVNTVLFTKCGIIVPGRFGVKLGDMVVLTEIGCTNLTSATKSLLHI